MTEEVLWEQFQTSGTVADYLQYAAQKGCKGFADSEGRCADTEADR